MKIRSSIGNIFVKERPLRMVDDPTGHGSVLWTLGDRSSANEEILVAFDKSRRTEPMFGQLYPSKYLPPPHLDVIGPIALLGYNESLAVLSSESGELIAEYDLNSPFRKFLKCRDRVLAFHEVGVISFLLPSFRREWSYDNDIIETIEIEGDTLIITFMDSPSVRIRISGGQVVG